MTTFIYIHTRGLEQACISWLHCNYCNYLQMIKAQFLIGQHFLGFDIIKKLENVISRTRPPKHQNDLIKDKIDL